MPHLYDDLRAEIENDPLGRGYAGMDNSALADSLNTKNRTITIDAPISDLFSLLLKRGIWPAIRIAAAGASSPTQASAQAMVDLVTTARLLTVQMTDMQTAAVVGMQLDALISGSVISTNDKSAILSLGQKVISRAEEIGWPDGVPLTSDEIAYAKALPA